jgi:hypothetical protein
MYTSGQPSQTRQRKDPTLSGYEKRRKPYDNRRLMISQRDGVHMDASIITNMNGLDRFGNQATLLNGKARGSLLAHELGHVSSSVMIHQKTGLPLVQWMGLLHTFQWPITGPSPTCDGPGDFVDDTPYELYTYSCNITGVSNEDRDSCPTKPGIDNLGNFMTTTEE